LRLYESTYLWANNALFMPSTRVARLTGGEIQEGVNNGSLPWLTMAFQTFYSREVAIFNYLPMAHASTDIICPFKTTRPFQMSLHSLLE
jgi:hypothetical protein